VSVTKKILFPKGLIRFELGYTISFPALENFVWSLRMKRGQEKSSTNEMNAFHGRIVGRKYKKP
jgi:hypothetical protein